MKAIKNHHRKRTPSLHVAVTPFKGQSAAAGTCGGFSGCLLRRPCRRRLEAETRTPQRDSASDSGSST